VGRVTRALAGLTAPARLAIILHYVNGYSHAEIAGFLGTTPGAVRTRVSRAKSRLREEALAMVEEIFEQAEVGFRWVVKHESGKARSSLRITGESATSKQEARELANASLWFDTALEGEPGFAAMRRQGAERWARHVLEECARHDFASVALKGPDASPRDGPRVTQLDFPDQEADPEWHRGHNIGWTLAEHAWQPLRDALATMFGATLPPHGAAAEGSACFRYQGMEYSFRARFSVSEIHISKQADA
jgi:hypothetical protein